MCTIAEDVSHLAGVNIQTDIRTQQCGSFLKNVSSTPTLLSPAPAQPDVSDTSGDLYFLPELY